jgi:hypothetical protein
MFALFGFPYYNKSVESYFAEVNMEYLTAKEIGELWGVSERRVQYLCENGQLKDVERLGKTWAIPRETPKPVDGRTKDARNKKSTDK